MKTCSFLLKETSTEVAVYEDGVRIVYEVLRHSRDDLHALRTPAEQSRFRLHAILEALSHTKGDLAGIESVITQAHIPGIASGLYRVKGGLLDLLKESAPNTLIPRSAVYLSHDIAARYTEQMGAACTPKVYVTSTDDGILPEAALSGFKGIIRRPVYHAFSIRAAVFLHKHEHPNTDNARNFIVAHLGSEISVAAYGDGRILDCNSPLDGEGPFSPTTSGSLPTDALVRLCFSGKYDMDEMMRMIDGEGGLMAHLGYAKLKEVEDACRNGDRHALEYVRVMAYKVAKEIGARAATLRGRCEAIILTGPWAQFNTFSGTILDMTEWIAPVVCRVWEGELSLLAAMAAVPED